MRILYFVNTAWYFELHWKDRVCKLINDGHDVHLITSFENDVIKNKLERLGIKCWHIDIDRFSINPIKNIKVLISFAKNISIINPDLIHTITIKPNIIGGVISRLKSIPQIMSIVGLGRVFLHDGLLKSVIKKLYWLVVYKNNKLRIIFEHVSDKVAMENIVTVDSSRLYVIDGAGIDTTKYSYFPEKKTGTINVLFASRLLKSKGLELLIQSIKLLKSEGVNVTLKVAGIVDENDPDRITLKQIKNWQEQGLIEWLGTRDDVDNLLRECNIMVLPTVYAEGIPRIILEACAIGRACIVGNMPGCRSIIKDKINGIVLAEHTIDNLILSLKYLIDNEDKRYDFGLKSAEIIKEKYSKETVIKKTVEVYQLSLSE